LSELENFWGNLIHDIRVEQRISQRRLASHAQVNRSTLRRIEEGRARGDVDMIEKLLGYMGYELEAITRDSRAERLRQLQEIEKDPEKRSRLARSRLMNLLFDSQKPLHF
jgi:transcriptional regulator with XRE-family HTH domain